VWLRSASRGGQPSSQPHRSACAETHASGETFELGEAAVSTLRGCGELRRMVPRAVRRCLHTSAVAPSHLQRRPLLRGPGDESENNDCTVTDAGLTMPPLPRLAAGTIGNRPPERLALRAISL
jgi:hypothetical protein